MKGQIKDSDVSFLTQHPIKYLDISESNGLTTHSLFRILEKCTSLKCLLVGTVISSGKLDSLNLTLSWYWRLC